MNAIKKRTLQDVLTPQSQGSAKHKRHKLTFDLNTSSLSDFHEELNEFAEQPFGSLAQQMPVSLLYSKLPRHLKLSINRAYSANGTHDQLAAQLERELELSGLKTDG